MIQTDIVALTALVVALLVAFGIGVMAAAALLSPRRRAHPGESDNFGLHDPGWRIESFIYRHHRLAGALIALASVIVLWQALRPQAWPGPAWNVAWSILVGAQVITLLVGTVMLFRPSALKPVERLANRRYELGRQGGLSLLAHPAIRFLVVLSSAGVVTAGLFMLLLERLGTT
jgi:hypothetical protein